MDDVSRTVYGSSAQSYPQSRNTIDALSAFYTPPGVARTVAKLAELKATDRVLEPSVGDGSLVRAAIELSAEAGTTPPAFVVCDINQEAVSSLEGLSPPIEKAIVGDFLSQGVGLLGQFDVVLGNPPFTRNHDIAPHRRAELRKRLGVQGAAGIWVHFVLHSLEFLKPGGRLVFIVPSAARFSIYSKNLIAKLECWFDDVSITEFRQRIEWRGGASERGSILVARGFRSEPALIRSPTLIPDVVSARARKFAAIVQLGELAEIRIGAVTGRNQIFLLNSEEREQAGIPLDDFIPVVARAVFAKHWLVKRSDLLDAADSGARVLLLCPRRYSAPVRRYLEARVSEADRQNISWFRRRDPWWQVDVGPRCDAVFTYMSHHGPNLALVERGVSCTNTLHHVRFSRSDATLRWSAALSISSTLGQLSAERFGRPYGGGVLKLEPSEVKRLPVIVPNGLPAGVIRDARKLSYMSTEERRIFADQVLLAPMFGSKASTRLREFSEELNWLRSIRLKV